MSHRHIGGDCWVILREEKQMRKRNDISDGKTKPVYGWLNMQ